MSAIKVDQVTKIYRLFDRPIDRLKESLNPFHKEYHKKFYALNEISFEVEQGQFVGIIGTNGSGKSTILKIITGVLTPTTGRVTVEGRVSALLELGGGFNMEYTGIENVYMNGTMMGYTRQEMDEKLQEILEFADIGDFVYQPVKTYSSGMFVRLAFALAINVDPDILIVDEALAVGDVFFQAKCYQKINEICKSGTTVLLVTHDMSTVIKYCDKVVVLNRGKFVAEGPAGQMVDLYKKILANQEDVPGAYGSGVESDAGDEGGEPGMEFGTAHSVREPGAEYGAGGSVREPEAEYGVGDRDRISEPMANGAEVKTEKGRNQNSRKPGETLWKSNLTLNEQQLKYGDGRAEIADVGLFDHNGELTGLILKGKPFTLKMRVRFLEEVPAPIFAFTIKDSKGTELTGTNTLIEDCQVETAKAGEEYVISFCQIMSLQGGEYLLSLGCTGFEGGEFVVHDRLYDAVNITVISNKNTVGVYDMDSTVSLEKRK